VRVAALIPDLPVAPATNPGDAASFARALDAVGDILIGANRAEDAFAYGAGTLQEAVYERAQADVALAVATSSAQRIAAAVQSVLNMQV
jgi:flagellar hook-basal body complex protein FliE